MAIHLPDPDHEYELARRGGVAARGTLSMVMRKGEGWSALFTTSMRGLDGEYELRFPHGERVPIRLRDLREAASDPSYLTGEVPYGSLQPRRLATYAILGDGRPFLV